MKNDFLVTGDKTIIYAFYKGKKFEVIISTASLLRVKEFPNKWIIHKKKSAFYVVASLNNKTVYLHRWLTFFPTGKFVDHLNHNPLDNTDSNLRIVTQAQNAQNRSTKSALGIRGVQWIEKRKKYRVKFKINKRYMNFGEYKTLEEAKQVALDVHKMIINGEFEESEKG